MKVLNLQCRQAHAFEGWFASEDDFQGQLGRGLVECPMCGDHEVSKLPSAPRLNLGAGRQEKHEVVATPDTALQAEWIKMMRDIMAKTEDVGERFAEEARSIHYGDSQERAIRGQATADETQALLDEGISVLPLPLPKGLKETLQ